MAASSSQFDSSVWAEIPFLQHDRIGMTYPISHCIFSYLAGVTESSWLRSRSALFTRDPQRTK
jgi:hypothetical protein